MNECFENREECFYRYCKGTATVAEKEWVDSLLAANPLAVAKELKQVREAVAIESKITELSQYNVSKAFEKVRRKIQRRKRLTLFKHTLLRVAAILILPLLISTIVLTYKLGNNEASEMVYVDIKAAPGSISSFMLPDSSKVWLNAGATLRYPVTFRGNVREVSLCGEGYFEVQSDKEHPFWVTTTSGLRVMAHGTQFNVNTEEDFVEAILAEGKVSVFLDDKSLVELHPGHQALYNEHTKKLLVSKVSLCEKLAWKDGKIVFRNASLSEVFHRLGRRYNVDIVLHDPHNQSDKYKARVTFKDETIQQIFTYLEAAAPLTWKLETFIQNGDSTLARQRIDVWLKK